MKYSVWCQWDADVFDKGYNCDHYNKDELLLCSTSCVCVCVCV